MSNFDVNNLLNAMGGEEALKNMCIDKGANFLDGKITSTFTQIQNSETKIYILHTFTSDGKEKTKKFLKKEEAELALKTANNAIENAPKDENGEKPKSKNYIEEGTTGSTFNNLANTATDIIGTPMALTVSPDLVTGIVMECTSIVFDKVQKKVQELVEFSSSLALSTPKKIRNFAQVKFDKEKVNLTDEIANLLKDKEKQIDDQVKKNQEESQNKGLNKILDKVASVKASVDLITSEINDKVSMIATHIAEGPDWLTNEINQTIEEKMNFANEFIDGKKKFITEEHEKFCKNQGDSIGGDMANKYNNIIKNEAKRQIDKINSNKVAAVVKAYSAIHQAKLKIMSMTGIDLPL